TNGRGGWRRASPTPQAGSAGLLAVAFGLLHGDQRAERLELALRADLFLAQLLELGVELALLRLQLTQSFLQRLTLFLQGLRIDRHGHLLRRQTLLTPLGSRNGQFAGAPRRGWLVSRPPGGVAAACAAPRALVSEAQSL